MAVSDVTALKRAEEAQRRMEDLAAANRKLQQEIVRRQAVETALSESAAQQRQLLTESRQMQEQLRHLSHQVLQAQEEERKRISRDLHDQIAQALMGINLHLTALARQATVDPSGSSRRSRARSAWWSRVGRYCPSVLPGTASDVLDDLGLVLALHAFMKDFTKRTGIHIAFTTFSAARITGLDSVRSTVLYRVAQEALLNVARHAHASHVEISLRKLPAAIEMKISDDGQGFAIERLSFPNAPRRLGVLGMRERVQMIGGKFSLESAPGQAPPSGQRCRWPVAASSSSQGCLRVSVKVCGNVCRWHKL